MEFVWVKVSRVSRRMELHEICFTMSTGEFNLTAFAVMMRMLTNRNFSSTVLLTHRLGESKSSAHGSINSMDSVALVL